MKKEVLIIMTDFNTSNVSYIDSVPGCVYNHRYVRASVHFSVQSMCFWDHFISASVFSKDIIKNMNFPQRILRIYSIAAWP